MFYILDGKMLSNEMMDALAVRADKLRDAGIHPYLTVVTTGETFAGEAFLKSKEKMAKQLGIAIIHEHFDVLQYKHLSRLHDPIIYQTPAVCNTSADIAMFIGKEGAGDVDGMSMINTSYLATGHDPYNAPCTAEAVIRILDRYDIPIQGKHVCVIGRSNSVGRPLSRMLEHLNATVTICHSETPRAMLYNLVYLADIVVSATGCRGVVNMDDMCRYECFDRLNEQVFVDVGINRDQNGNLCGDIDPEIAHYCMAYTPVPGGIGPVTTAVLMEHVIKYFERQL